MDQVITSAALWEPRADLLPDGSPIGVHVNLDIRDAAGADEEALRTAFAEFLTALPKARYRACTIGPNGPALGPWLEPLIAPDPPGSAAEITRWLEDGGQALWAGRSGSDTLREGDRLTAGQRLSGSQGWPAPLPQRAALTRVLAMPTEAAGAPEQAVYLLPFLGWPDEDEPAAPIQGAQGADGLLTFTYEVWHAKPPSTCEASPAPARDTDPTSLVDASGFLRVPTGDSADSAEAVRRIRERSGALFWAAPHLVGIAWPRAADTRDAWRRLVWRGVSAVSSLLDPILMTLSMADDRPSGRSASRMGPVTGAMAILVRSATDDHRMADAFVTGMKDWVSAASGDRWTPVGLIQRASAILGQAEWAALARPEALAQARGYDPTSRPVLPFLLLAFAGIAQPPALSLSELEDAETCLDGELAALLSDLGAESGMEAAFSEIFSDAGLARPILTTAVGDASAERVLSEWRRLLDTQFDGLSAARQACGAIHARLATARARDEEPPTIEALHRRLQESDWMLARIGLANGGCLAPLLGWLPRFGFDLDEADSAMIRMALGNAHRAACDELLGEAAGNPRRRFVPDPKPRNLALRIGVDANVDDADLFGQRYDGVGVLVRREGERWAHANLAQLNRNGAPTVLPLQPAVVDGERELFLEFTGAPFSRGPLSASREGPQPFFSFDAPPAAELDNHDKPDPTKPLKLPALAYGTTYETACFTVSRNGVLPAGVALEDDPLSPRAVPTTPGAGGPFTSSRRYLRTTAIGRVALEHAAGGAFSAPLDRIQPLTRDYPRIGVTAAAGSGCHLDLWRQGDGLGSLPVPAPGEPVVELVLRDFRFAGSGRVEVVLAAGPGRESQPISVTVGPGDPILRVQPRPDDSGTLDWSFEWRDAPITGAIKLAKDDEHVWLRLQPVADAGASATVSMASPAGALTGRVSGDPGLPDNFVALAPPGKGWRSDFPTTAEFTVRHPAMGFEDFDRWLQNPALLAEAAAGEPDRLNQFRTDLLTTQIDPALGPGFAANAAALQDLAVSALQVELTVLDALGPPPASPAPKVLPLQKLGDLLAHEKVSSARSFIGRLEAIGRLLATSLTIKSADQVALEVTSGPASRIEVTAPRGTAIRVAIRPMVPRRHFDSGVIDERLLELAVGRGLAKGEACVLFDGPAATVEIMDRLDTDAGWPELCESWLQVQPHGTARRYGLALVPRHERQWRHLGTAEVTTQRWRFLGRPLHASLAPKQLAHTPPNPGEPVVRLRTRAGASVAAFEREAFARDDRDAQRHWARLRPLGETSTLQDVEWETPAATIFRHRLRLRGRYAGALDDPELGTVKVVHAAEPRGRVRPFDDWVRVALLADRSRLTLTRPQLRALIPLTIPAEEGSTPPILAMLTEPPFAHGGLADRIASGVATSLGYAMIDRPGPATQAIEAAELPTPPAEGDGGGSPENATSQADRPKALTVVDSRPEAGPDPILTYRAPALSKLQALSIEAEGPIGLTFDPPDGPAPTFPNTAWLLTPRSVGRGDDDWQDHFVSITMARYLDPDWLPDEQGDAKAFPFAEARWFEVGGDGSRRNNVYTAAVERPEQQGEPPIVLSHLVATVLRRGPLWMVYVEREALLESSPRRGRLRIAAVADETITGLALLHRPLEGRGAAMSVMALRRPDPAGAASGGSDIPQQLATFEWRCSKQADELILVDPPGRARRTSASAPTAMEWARTGRDADRASIGGGATIATSGLRAVARGGTMSFTDLAGAPVWPRGSTSDAPTPLFVQRHLAVLPTRVARGRGRPIETYDPSAPARLLLGATATSAVSAGLVRLVEIELPARPLCAGAKVQAADRQADFDLGAIGVLESRLECLLLIVRLAGGAGAAGAAIPRLTMSVGKRACTFDAGNAAAQTKALVVKVRPDGTLRFARVDAVGAVGPFADGGTLSATLEGTPGVATLKFADDPWPAEWRADASMLTLPDDDDAPDSPKLRFDWLFPAEPEGSGAVGEELATALGHAALRRLPEAQARIISVSAPIRIDDGGSP